MAAQDITTETSAAGLTRRPRKFYISGLALRVLIALIISWLVVMAFFVTGVSSH